MRPPPDCRPSVGASAPKGTCCWLSPFGGSAVRTALNYNYHRVAGRILCRRLKYATGYCKWQSGLAATIHFEIQPFIPSEVRDFYLVKFTLNLIFQIGR
ncbi:unnamed protein product [Brassica rapa]|uniref:Uncharacterized protein n=1 Tax=Brassica campestris TaxID=3711 RepID=A0A8D9FZ23_BRACM|nr:unnamed protein product [Brassica rapa]